MLNDRVTLERIKREVMSKENSYARMKQENVMEKLLLSIDKKTQKLLGPIIIPKFEHDGNFLKKTLQRLGYSPMYTEEYNNFYQGICYVVTL